MVVEASTARVLASVTTAKRGVTIGSGGSGDKDSSDGGEGDVALFQPDALVQAIRAHLGETDRTSAHAP